MQKLGGKPFRKEQKQAQCKKVKLVKYYQKMRFLSDLHHKFLQKVNIFIVQNAYSFYTEGGKSGGFTAGSGGFTALNP